MKNSRYFIFLLFIISFADISCSNHDDEIDAIIDKKDTIWMPQVIYDTIYKDSIIHDTIYKDSIVHDTIIQEYNIHDTLLVDSLIYDTIVVENVVHDTIVVDSFIHDTIIIEHGINKIRIASWNLGHFALGKSYDTSITHNNYEQMRQEWLNAVNSISADILCCCEYNTNFVNKDEEHDAITAQTAIFPSYHFAYIGTKPNAKSYMQTAIFSHFPLENVKQRNYSKTVQAGRYFQYGDLNIDGKTIKIVSTHLDFNQTSDGAAYRKVQMQELLNFFTDSPYVIICADWNVYSPQEYDMFAEAGWMMANHGAMGIIPTYPAGNNANSPIDNIICKGFDISSISVFNNAAISDHMAIYADFTLIE